MPMSCRLPAHSRNAGFTLLELIVVSTIVAVVMALTVGPYSKMMTQQRVNKAAFALSNELQQAFALAGRNRRPVRIVWDAASLQLRVTNRGQDTVYRRISLGAGAGFNLASSNVTIYPSSSTPLEIYPTGLATDTMSITLSANGFSKRIWVGKGGIVDMRTQ
jgi:prepilin-type N-terminal cleavage/methylation domain-containing protein